MRALTVRQPWPLAMLYCDPPKRIENRTWATPYRGPILIHASLGCSRREWCEAIDWMGASSRELARFGAFEHAPRGGIVARATLVDIIEPYQAHRLSDDPWYTGDCGWVLADVRPLPFLRCTGALKLWDASRIVAAAPAQWRAMATRNENGATCRETVANVAWR